MKKVLSILTLVFASISTLFAQTPSVAISVQDITPTTFTVDFQKNDACQKYHIISMEPGQAESWLTSPMFAGYDLNSLLISWGITCTQDTVYTWKEMTPNENYVIYAVAVGGSDTVLCTDTIKTVTLGGVGESAIAVSVTDVTDNTVTTKATPNDQTAYYKDALIAKWAYDEFGVDSVKAMLIEDPYTLYDEDVWTWFDLNSGTEYYFIAIGANINDEWGEMAMCSFTTTGVSLNEIENSIEISVYPNPTIDNVVLTTEILQSDAKVVLTDILGKVVDTYTLKAGENTLNMETKSLKNGTYFVRLIGKDIYGVEKLVKK